METNFSLRKDRSTHSISIISMFRPLAVSSLSRFRPQHGLHPKIGRTNFGGILHHSARLRKQKTLKILGFVLYVEDYHKLTNTQFLTQSPSTN